MYLVTYYHYSKGNLVNILQVVELHKEKKTTKVRLNVIVLLFQLSLCHIIFYCVI